MKFSVLAVTLLASAVMAAPPTDKGKPESGSGGFETCEEQQGCMSFTVEKESSDECDGGDCQFKICMKVDLSTPGCDKSGTISHACEKTTGQCNEESDGFPVKEEPVSDGYEVCQIVEAEKAAEFIIKDGNSDTGCGVISSYDLGDTSAMASCKGTVAADNSCTGGGNIGKECMWTIQAPSCANGGGGGDPHIKLWTGDRYSYHGECDLVMLSAPDFDGEKGLDLHIRTTSQDFYSFIESAALKIGKDVLEVTSGKFYINGKEQSDEDLPLQFGDYEIGAPYQSRSAKVYQLDLNEHNHIKFRTYKTFVSIDMSGSKTDFGNSLGLLGNYYTGEFVGRDGETVLESEEVFGSEWQVQPSEPKLFVNRNREPQLPMQSCIMPVATQRHLREMKDPAEVMAAEGACGHKSMQDFEFCVTDVLATGDLGMAGAW